MSLLIILMLLMVDCGGKESTVDSVEYASGCLV